MEQEREKPKTNPSSVQWPTAPTNEPERNDSVNKQERETPPVTPVLASGYSEVPESGEKSHADVREKSTTHKSASDAKLKLPSYDQSIENNDKNLIADPVPAMRHEAKKQERDGLLRENADQDQRITSNDLPPLGYDTSQRMNREGYDGLNQAISLVTDLIVAPRIGGVHLADGTFKQLRYGEKAVIDAGTITFTEDKSSAAVPSMKIQSTGWNFKCKGKTFRDSTLKEADWAAMDWADLIQFQREALQIKLTPTQIRRTEREVVRAVKAEDQAKHLTATQQCDTLENAQESGSGASRHRGWRGGWKR